MVAHNINPRAPMDSNAISTPTCSHANLPFDDEYMRRLADGDPEAEHHFCNYFTSLIRTRLRSQLYVHQLIEDILQETLMRVIRSIRSAGGLRRPGNLGGFVLGVCKLVTLEMLRTHSRQPQIPDEIPEQADESADPASGLKSTERKELVERVLAELPEKDQELLRMLFFEEREKDEICQKMGVTPKYLRVLVHRAKARFRALYEKYDA